VIVKTLYRNLDPSVFYSLGFLICKKIRAK
jgi:hypothetical protein